MIYIYITSIQLLFSLRCFKIFGSFLAYAFPEPLFSSFLTYSFLFLPARMNGNHRQMFTVENVFFFGSPIFFFENHSPAKNMILFPNILGTKIKKKTHHDIEI